MTIRFPVALAALAAVAVGGAAVAAPVSTATQPGSGDVFWSSARWDDDDADDRRFRVTPARPMPRPDQAALRAAGVTRVLEVERDDGRIEVEGRDARGREIDVKMDAAGKKVLRVERGDD
ncbi:MAG: PepSY domain-containing protein [Caulobacter sp.]|nr:PepSY domain-containing protein [Caulobacter sp.]